MIGILPDGFAAAKAANFPRLRGTVLGLSHTQSEGTLESLVNECETVEIDVRNGVQDTGGGVQF